MFKTTQSKLTRVSQLTKVLEVSVAPSLFCLRIFSEDVYGNHPMFDFDVEFLLLWVLDLQLHCLCEDVDKSHFRFDVNTLPVVHFSIHRDRRRGEFVSRIPAFWVIHAQIIRRPVS